MLVEHIEDIVVGAMVQLLHCGLLHVLRRKVLSILLMAPGKNFIMNGLDTNHAWMSIVKWS
jgi:hypothetical protein